MRRKKYQGPIYGPFYFNIYKPVGKTSFDVIRALQRNLPRAIGKIGHFGTLDPFAEGVLLIGIGQAPRLNQWTQDLPKEYVATGIFGTRSPTGDLTVEEDQIYRDESFSNEMISKDAVTAALNEFVGEYRQIPHQYSATKYKGKPLYEWARDGVEIVKDPVDREIYEIELLEFDGRECKFRVKVSSGTYIRVLFEDLAKKLGTVGVLSALVRTEVGHHKIESSVKEESWPDHFENSDEFLASSAKGVDSLVHFKELDLDETQAKKYINGVKVPFDVEDGDYWAVNNNMILGLAEAKNGILRSSVNFQPSASRKIDLTIRNSLD